ncbi:MAG: sigma-54-dependent Fis family transcriptional regulator [Myxococcales bacterium]|nr:sigma-54-dependent Fis family transcriptional regulator [Myxococcales bacterium]
MSRVLVTWCGATDLKAGQGDPSVGLGPVAQAAAARNFDQIVVLSNYARTESAAYDAWLKTKTKTPVVLRTETLRSPTDYADIYRVVSKTLDWISAKLAPRGKLTFHLSPGTPAMATVWILLAPKYGAELIQSSREAGVENANLPFEIAAEFVPALVKRAGAELERLGEGVRPEDPSFKDILHRSDSMKRLLERAQQAAPYDAPILIEGESGTGKELLAAALHKASGRRGRFVPVNCGAIPRDLVESAFFGHTRGAFTGATDERAGAFESADGGTLFLDEVGELPLEAQVKLLRALQEKKIQRIGARTEKAVDVRVVAATNRDLLAEVRAGRFREDLYFRLAVLLLRSPPLREREGDLSLLLDRQLETLNAERPAISRKKLSSAAKSLLLRHDWPGNVRELQATLLRAFVWSKGATIDDAAVREALVPGARSRQGEVLDRPLAAGFRIQDPVSEVVRHYLGRALAEAHGNKTRAAALVGFSSYQTLTNWLKKYGVEG